MSIATLKRKTKTQYNNISVGQPAFSLNGTRRSQGYVGQTSLSRSLPRTPMNGPTPRGYGGCCGTYPQTPIIQSAVTSLNDPKVVKGSVITTNGMIEEKLNCIANIDQKFFITCGPTTKCYNITKPDNNRHLNDQADYIKNKAKKTIQTTNLTCNSKISNLKKPCKNSCNNPSFNNYTKPQSDFIPISQGEYLIQKNNNCISSNVTNASIASTIKKTPFACGL